MSALSGMDLTNANKKENQVDTSVTMINPTMMDLSENKEEKQVDLSAIIPTDSEVVSDVNLESKDKLLRSDGAVVVATVKNDNEIVMSLNPSLPTPIDIEARRLEQQKQNQHKKYNSKVKRDVTGVKKMQKKQTLAALGSLVVIAFLGLFAYYYFNKSDLVVLNIKEVIVEIGDPVSHKPSDYVVSDGAIDELEYFVDLTKVNSDIIGEYPYTVTYKGKTVENVIKVTDSKPPVFEVRNVEINEKDSYKPEDFIANPYDISGIDYDSYAFTDKNMYSYTKPGEYEVYVTLKDAYGNATQPIKAKLTIWALGKNNVWSKTIVAVGYTMLEEYDIKYTTAVGMDIILSGTRTITYTYTDEDKFKEDKAKYVGEQNYNIDNENKVIKYVTQVGTIGHNYSRKTDIEQYLVSEGFSKK